LEERERFVSDIHHRLKSNLQVITSIVSLQASRAVDPQIRDVLRGIHNRVRAIAVMHEPAYSTADFSTIHFGMYLEHLVRELAAEYAPSGDRIELDIRAADIALDMDDAIALALIANELVANAFEHAFEGDRSGTIAVTLSYRGAPTRTPAAGYGELRVSDNGVGLTAGLDFKTAESTGFYLVNALTRQLRGRIRLDERVQGTSFLVAFPLGREESLGD
jgi:two-component sensor histidine kinase